MAVPAVRAEWQVVVLRQAQFRRAGGRVLLVQYGGELEAWKAIALEVPARGGAQRVLADHGHRAIGAFATERAARRACEAFARQWLRGKTIDACACEEIEAPRRRRRST